MHQKDDINSILNAINEINQKVKKKNIIIPTQQTSIPKFNHNLSIPADVSKLITDAEEYKKLSNNYSKINLTQNLKNQTSNNSAFVLTDEVEEISNSKNENITKLITKVANLEEIEKKLRNQVTVLQREKVLLSKKSINTSEEDNPKDILANTKAILKSIYNQVEQQKQVFIDLKKYSIKIERDSRVYKENYERLVIEINELKKRLKIIKEQILDHESSKKELLFALDQLNLILSKNNIAGKISPPKTFSEIKNFNKTLKTDPAD